MFDFVFGIVFYERRAIYSLFALAGITLFFFSFPGMWLLKSAAAIFALSGYFVLLEIHHEIRND